MFPLRERLFADPFAPPAFTDFVTTMGQSDFWQAFGFSPFAKLKSPLPYFRSLSDLPGMQILLAAALLLRCARHALGPRRNLRHSRISTAVLLPATRKKVSASALYNLRGCIASRFRIAALALHCLRLNLTSRLRLQGCVPAAC